jgi:hypothetical protein
MQTIYLKSHFRSKISGFCIFKIMQALFIKSLHFTLMTLSLSTESTTHLSHYGLIAGVFDELGISDLVDDLLPKKSGHNIPHSTVLKAMCINGLGFTERRLYLFPAFFENLPIERLLGEGVLPKHLNDDVFGNFGSKLRWRTPQQARGVFD